MRRALLPLLAFTFALSSVPAAPVPHPDRPDRLVETRDGLTVEYSPGQEAWMEMAFRQMQATAREPAIIAPPAPRRAAPAVPGSAQYLEENRDVILAAIARHTGLSRSTDLQHRTFDTFLGYYKLTSELMQGAAANIPVNLPPRHLAIWHRDDVVARLRAGNTIEGLSYDPVTDRGNFSINFELTGAAVLGERFRQIHAEIDEQRVQHRFSRGNGTISASVSTGKTPEKTKTRVEKPAVQTDDLDAILSQLVVPIVYRGEAATAPTENAFNSTPQYLVATRQALMQQAADYRNASMVSIILHETAEIGLIENIITSPDRRWLCDGTANYVAWRAARDLLGADFAREVYDLDAQLRLHARQQPKINLAGWPAAENQQQDQSETDLNRAHYAFATRAMFLLAERHGESALAQLWKDVTRTPQKKVTAKTFAEAYRKRFKADLAKLVRDAEQKPIPSATPTAPKS
jgi:hypothetical protein